VSGVETQFLLISHAVSRLEAGMFGGSVTRPEPIKKLKKQEPRLSVGFGPHREKASEVILTAILAGDLSVHLFAQSNAEEPRLPIVVPIDVLQLMPQARSGLPDRPVRHPVNFLRNHPVTPVVFAALSVSALHLQRTEFEAWYEKQKQRLRWPSQRTSSKPRVGRPSKQTARLLNLIRALVAEEKWSASEGIAKLVKLLVPKGAPLRNTLRRAVDQLYIETGDPNYRIVPRKRMRRMSGDRHT
jgi:hypothetical protein